MFFFILRHFLKLDVAVKFCILGYDPAIMLVHEAIGHTVEADLVMGGSIAGRYLGKSVASELITLGDFAHDMNGLPVPQPIYVDDEGTPARDAMIIENLPKKKVRLVSRLTGKGLNFSFDGFDALGLWTPDHKQSPFICLEPWNGLPADVAETTDAKSKKYARTIAPDEEYTVGYEVTVIR